HQRVVDRGVTLHDALHLFREHLLAAGVDARRLASEEHDPAVGGVAGPVAADRVAHAVDDRGGRARLALVAEVAQQRAGRAPRPPRGARGAARTSGPGTRLLWWGGGGAPPAPRGVGALLVPGSPAPAPQMLSRVMIPSGSAASSSSRTAGDRTAAVLVTMRS